MGSYTADTSRLMFNSQKQYAAVRFQQGKAVIDADLNDGEDMRLYGFRKLVTASLGSQGGFVGTGFEIQQSGISTVNNFKVKAGLSSVNGYMAELAADAEYNNAGASVNDKNIHSVVTGLAATVLTDTAMNWTVNELAGRVLVPDITKGYSYTVLSNTATAITIVSGNMLTDGLTVGASYRVNLSTPSGSSRTDTVWLNIYLDEINSTEDPDLVHALGAGYTSALRLKVRTMIQIEQGAAAYTDYTDIDGNPHVLVKLATLSRLDGKTNVLTAMIADERGGLSATNWLSMGDYIYPVDKKGVRLIHDGAAPAATPPLEIQHTAGTTEAIKISHSINYPAITLTLTGAAGEQAILIDESSSTSTTALISANYKNTRSFISLIKSNGSGTAPAIVIDSYGAGEAVKLTGVVNPGTLLQITQSASGTDTTVEILDDATSYPALGIVKGGAGTSGNYAAHILMNAKYTAVRIQKGDATCNDPHVLIDGYNSYKHTPAAPYDKALFAVTQTVSSYGSALAVNAYSTGSGNSVQDMSGIYVRQRGPGYGMAIYHNPGVGANPAALRIENGGGSGTPYLNFVGDTVTVGASQGGLLVDVNGVLYCLAYYLYS